VYFGILRYQSLGFQLKRCKKWVENNDVPNAEVRKSLQKRMKTNVRSAISLGQEELQEKHLKKTKFDFKNPH
jgi:DNA-binding transcriptional MerR regulator